MYTGDLIGKEVVGAEGWKIGEVKEIVIDKDKWIVTALSVNLESKVAREFNLKKLWGKSDFRIAVGHVQGVADRIVLKIGKSQLSEIAKTAMQETDMKQESDAPTHQ